MPLTDVACRNAVRPPDEPRERYSGGLGMYLEVTPTGNKYWSEVPLRAEREKRPALGVHPEVTLAAARRGRDEARELHSEGRDPVAPRKETKLVRQAAIENTFEAISRACHEQ